MSQCDRVLVLLRARGAGGVNTAELQEIPTADGGAPILRLAARIDNLKHRGYTISSRRQQNGTSTYTLIREPDNEMPLSASGGTIPRESTSTQGSQPPDVGMAALFDTSPLERRGDYRDADQAA